MTAECTSTAYLYTALRTQTYTHIHTQALLNRWQVILSLLYINVQIDNLNCMHAILISTAQNLSRHPDTAAPLPSTDGLGAGDTHHTLPLRNLKKYTTC